ncbi:hypothetical protein DX902_22660 [Paenibacillus jamilae]|nr:hypothetical protein C1T20_24565 [Paenibacillus polymyxa]RFT93103.1 hypothetical protein DX902_22660 [Paenibacillus jamilae]
MSFLHTKQVFLIYFEYRIFALLNLLNKFVVEDCRLVFDMLDKDCDKLVHIVRAMFKHILPPYKDYVVSKGDASLIRPAYRCRGRFLLLSTSIIASCSS